MIDSIFNKTIFIGEQSLHSLVKESFIEILSTISEYKYVWIHQHLATPLVYDILLASDPEQIILFTNLGFEENAEDFWIRYNRVPYHLFIEISQYSASRTQKYTHNVSYVYGGAWKKKLEESFSKFITEIENATIEFKKDIKNLFLDNVKEIEVFSTKLGKVFITD